MQVICLYEDLGSRLENVVVIDVNSSKDIVSEFKKRIEMNYNKTNYAYMGKYRISSVDSIRLLKYLPHCGNSTF